MSGLTLGGGGDAVNVQNHREAMQTSAPSFEVPRVSCIRSAESARRCVKETCHLDGTIACLSMCQDTATVLEALVEMLERPFEPSRAVSLRRMIEAGLATSAECATECNEHADEARVCALCADDCQHTAAALRDLLRELADDAR